MDVGDPNMNKFRLAFYFQSNKILLDNYLSQDNVANSITLSNGMQIWIGRGSYIFNPPPKTAKSKESIDLKEVIDEKSLDEIRHTLQEMFGAELSVMLNDHVASVESISPVESSATVPGHQYQRVYRVSHTIKLEEYRFLKLDLSLAGNRPFSSLREEIFNELNTTEALLFNRNNNAQPGPDHSN
jgi:hypothetical protein